MRGRTGAGGRAGGGVRGELCEGGAWWEANGKAGLIVPGVGNRLQPVRTARTVRVDIGRSSLTDGPFAETKEAIGGFGLINAPDMQAAVELLKTWPGLPITIEIRPVLEG
ncbi:MAG: transcription initiation protein [Chloroflexi bacterium]|nr:transcription initiation protein [Chloroflexota bacterium]